jgi:ABC-type uncharacterized transport system fused permease/ATPase subunit
MNVDMKPNKLFRYFLSISGLVLCLLSFIAYKVVAVGSASFINNLLGNKGWTILLSIVLYFLLLGALFPVVKYLIGKGLYLEEFSRKFNRSYIAQYGNNYPKPKFEDFGLTPEEYFTYNKRFQIDPNLVALLVANGSILTLLTITDERSFTLALIAFLLGIVSYLLTSFLVSLINKRLSLKWSNHVSLHKYIHQLSIYDKLQKEIKDNANAFKGWTD